MTEQEDLTVAASGPGATVAYKGWVTSATGREAIEIVLPLGAPSALLDQAIEQWHQMRAAAQRATQPVSAERVAPAALVLSFGKYQGRTLGEVLEIDLGYTEWLSQAARDATIRNGAGELLAARVLDQSATADQLNQAPAPADDASEVPF
jgi:Exodeoxyribonuclease X-like C-terminal